MHVRRLSLSFLLALASSLASCGGRFGSSGGPRTRKGTSVSAVSVSDVVPYQVDGHGASIDNVAGATLAIAGGDTLYAVSFGAGVWRWIHQPNDLTSWQQLPSSPPHAYSIAVDPTNTRHVAVGERDGDAPDPSANHSGVWESFDGGDSWPVYFDPRSNPACSSQVVPSVAFTAAATLVAATTCGLAVERAGTWAFVATPLGGASISAVAASETKVWARDRAGNLTVSADGGIRWSALPAVPTDYQPNQNGDVFTLAATDRFALEIVAGDFVPTRWGGNHQTGLHVYDAISNSWSFHQGIHDHNDPAGAVESSLDGTGDNAHSRRFVKAYATAPGGPPSFFVGDGQRVFQEIGVDATTGERSWQTIIISEEEDAPAPPAPYQNKVHSELWDFHLWPDGKTMWTTTDGGVWRNNLHGAGWSVFNSGLHTFHAHDVFTDDGTHISFVTQDNDAWAMAPGLTSGQAGLGDANSLWGDVNANGAFAVASRGPGLAVLEGFGHDLGDAQAPGATAITIGLTPGSEPWWASESRNYFALIRTLENEPTPPSPLDALLFTPLPFKVGPSGVVLVDGGGQPSAILRNRTLAAHPDANRDDAAGWSIFADHIPADAIGMQVAGGHAHPVLYVYGASNLYRSNGQLPTTWTPLPVLGAGASAQLLVGSAHGPVFVNPFNAQMIYALTAQGVRVSTDGGASFNDDKALTDFITGGGRYPLTGNFAGQNLANVHPSIKNGGNALATLASLSFDRRTPANLVAASPFTGIFVKNGSDPWFDFSDSLPRPRTAVSGVARAGSLVLVSMEGRGVVALTLPCFAKPSCTGGAQCGTQDDGCGGTLSCGSCTNGFICSPSQQCLDPSSTAGCEARCKANYQTCIDGADLATLKACQATENLCLCECHKPTCASVGAQCGPIPDGCGFTQDCGGCTPGFACSANQCVCVPTETSCNGHCGNIADGCGGVLHCGSCACVCSGTRCGECGGKCLGPCRSPKMSCNPDDQGFYSCSVG